MRNIVTYALASLRCLAYYCVSLNLSECQPVCQCPFFYLSVYLLSTSIYEWHNYNGADKGLGCMGINNNKFGLTSLCGLTIRIQSMSCVLWLVTAQWNCDYNFVGCGGSLVDSSPFVRRVVGSNPTLGTMLGPWASPSLAVVCGALAWSSDTVSVLWRERLWGVVDLKRRYWNRMNEWLADLLEL